jgi:Holliday junction resolvase
VNPSKRKGDRAELEVQGLLRDHLGVPARRALGAGRKDDIGDITGVPNTTIQVANHKNVAHAVRHKPLEVEQQRRNADTDHACTFIRLPGGDYRVVLTVQQWCELWRDAQP